MIQGIIGLRVSCQIPAARCIGNDKVLVVKKSALPVVSLTTLIVLFSFSHLNLQVHAAERGKIKGNKHWNDFKTFLLSLFFFFLEETHWILALYRPQMSLCLCLRSHPKAWRCSGAATAVPAPIKSQLRPRMPQNGPSLLSLVATRWWAPSTPCHPTQCTLCSWKPWTMHPMCSAVQRQRRQQVNGHGIKKSL